MVSALAQRNIDLYEVKPTCGTCDFWGPFAYGDDGEWRGECRIHEFLTHVNMACDEWELD